jgi:hypothetical protein
MTPSPIPPVDNFESRLKNKIFKLPADREDFSYKLEEIKRMPIDDSLPSESMIQSSSYNPTPIIPAEPQFSTSIKRVSPPPNLRSLEPSAMINPSMEQLNSLELQQLRSQLRYKELEIKRLHRSSDPAFKSNHDLQSPMDIYNTLNKQVFDKKRIVDSKRDTVEALRYQVQQKEKQRQLEAYEKEQAILKRFEEMELMRQKQELDRLEKLQREKEYRDHLATQSLLKQELRKYEEDYPQQEASYAYPEADSEMRIEADNEAALPPSVYYTKKSPIHKAVIYNPITNQLKDTSSYLQPENYKFSNSTSLSPAKRQFKVAADFSVHPAFKQPLYTKSSPKYVPTSPITGDLFTNAGLVSNTQLRSNTEEDRQENKSLAGYGNMVISRPNPK